MDQGLPFNQDEADETSAAQEPVDRRPQVPTINPIHLNNRADSDQPLQAQTPAHSTPAAQTPDQPASVEEEDDTTGDIDIPPFLR